MGVGSSRRRTVAAEGSNARASHGLTRVLLEMTWGGLRTSRRLQVLHVMPSQTPFDPGQIHLFSVIPQEVE